MTEQVASPAYTDQGLSPRLSRLRRHRDQLAAHVEEWRNKNRAFHAQDLAYLRFLIPTGLRVLDVGCGIGEVLAELAPSHGVGLELSPAMVDIARRRYPHLEFHTLNPEDGDAVNDAVSGEFDIIVLSDTIGFVDDAEALLSLLRRFAAPHTRLIVSYHASGWEPILWAAEQLGLKMPQEEPNWLSSDDIMNLMNLAGWQPIKQEWRQLLPKHLLGLGTAINRWIAPLPLIRRLCLRNYVVARLEPVPAAADATPPSVTVLVPCRNERGNIEDAVRRLPRFCPDMEILYVEGHSQDGTYEECLRVRDAYPQLDIKVMRQPGKGKGDAVHAGFAVARGDILIILDADLTVPPETLPKFYEAMRTGKGEFVNGTRLVYPMEDRAMRFLNYLANRGFARIFSFLLNTRFTDTLCGTKVMWREDYRRIMANRAYFGDFDPFGDFDLIFGAAKLNLKIVEVPIRYADRTYGETQISRFRHGVLLARMVVFAWRKLKAF